VEDPAEPEVTELVDGAKPIAIVQTQIALISWAAAIDDVLIPPRITLFDSETCFRRHVQCTLLDDPTPWLGFVDVLRWRTAFQRKQSVLMRGTW
jgi:hypothetical protein